MCLDSANSASPYWNRTGWSAGNFADYTTDWIK